jgi:proline iminopeptidase
VNPSDQDSTSGVIERDGVSLRYVREGNGVPTIVIGSSMYYPRAFSRSLRDHLDLTFSDARHFVPSYEPSESDIAALTLETWADDVEVLRKTLGIDQWIVIGHSIHAQIALAYAHKYPRAIDRLVLIAGVPYSGTDVGQASRDIWDSQASQTRKAQHDVNVQGLEAKLAETPPNRKFVVNYMANTALYWADPTYDSAPLWESIQTSEAVAELAQSIPAGRSEVRDMLEGLESQTLVIVGKRDYAMPFTVWPSLIADIPEISYVLMEQDSHNPQTESPDRFDPILLDWLEL